jgi:quercetin dioxygenase-like cupin family protein
MSSESFKEPNSGESAGRGVVSRQPFPYEQFMQLQGIPIYEGPGFKDVRELDLGDWDRRGGRGAFLVLDQLTHLTGIYVVEVPPGGELNPEKHIYEEKFFVVEGEGTTELWLDGGHMQRFEWQSGSLFAIPVNTNYPLVNARSSSALLLSANTAPPVINIYNNLDFVFSNRFQFTERYDGSDDYFFPSVETTATPELGRAMWSTNFVPDIVNCPLPLDNVRSPGYRRIELPRMARGNFWGFVGEYVSGRYAKAHVHGPGAVLVCIKGKGYTYTWPSSIGTTPWKDGCAEQVERIDYVSGGMVAAAPGAGDWFHQHFGVGREPLRLLVFQGGLPGGPYRNFGGRRGKTISGKDLEQGGNAISYKSEDPHIRKEYKEQLAGEGVAFDMDET